MAIPVFVLASDGKYYKDPVVRDPARSWILTFDDNEEPELCYREGSTLPRLPFLKIHSVARKVGKRAFRTSRYELAEAVRVELIKPIPVPADGDHEGVYVEIPEDEEAIAYG